VDQCIWEYVVCRVVDLPEKQTLSPVICHLINTVPFFTLIKPQTIQP
jgi:hypothetical protein